MTEKDQRRRLQADGRLRRRLHHRAETGHQRPERISGARRRHRHQYVPDHPDGGERARKAEPATVDEAAKLTASGLLRGARGNSGVILSLLFRGMSKVLQGPEPPGRRPAGRGHGRGRSHCLRRGDEARRGHGAHRLPPGRPACAGGRRRGRTAPNSCWTRPSRPAIPPWRRPSR